MRAGVSTTAPARLNRIDPRVAIGAITVFGLLVRLAGAGHTLNHDEGYTWLVGSAPSAGSFLYRLAAYENTPPLYYLLLEGLPLSHEFWVRLPALIAGTATIPVLYALAKPAFGTRVALLAALALAIAPYHVANSDLARGFTLADFALLCAIWAMMRIVSGGDGDGGDPRARRWLVLYAVAAVVAVYSEYDAAATLIPLALAVAYLVPARQRVRAAPLAFAPLVALAPWAHQLSRSLNLVHVTKAGGFYLNVAPGTVRDQLVPLVYGQTGTHLSGVARTLALLAAVGVVAAGLCLMATGPAAAVAAGARARATTVLLGACFVGTLLLHMLAPAVGIGIFNQRYLTVLIPLACVPFAYLLTRLPWRSATLAAAIALAAFGCGLAIKRLHNDTEPDPALIRAAVAKYHPGTILTNSAVADYYLRDLHPILDRPLGFGVGRQHDCGGCRKPVVIVDDTEEGGGARPGSGPATRIGHYLVGGFAITRRLAASGRAWTGGGEPAGPPVRLGSPPPARHAQPLANHPRTYETDHLATVL